MRDAQPRPPEDVDQIERSRRVDRLSQRPERGHSQDRVAVRVDRHAVVPCRDEGAEHAERRPARVSRGAHDGDPASRLQHTFDPRVVEDGDRPASLLQAQERGGALPFLAGQWAASRSYGWPSAAGGMLRPTTPARMMIVSRYGSASKNWGGS